MKQEIKFKYVFQNDETGYIMTRVFDMEHIENGFIHKFMDEVLQYSLIKRLQFVGLKDKDGFEIYEGDIIPLILTHEVGSFKECSYINTNEDGTKTYNKISVEPCVVRRGKLGYEFFNKRHGITKPLCIANVDNATWKIIGNIYENNNLLK